MFSVTNRFERRGWIGALLAVGLCAPLPLGAQPQGDSDFDKTVSQGEAAFARGWLDEAILYWTGALDAAVKLGQPADRAVKEVRTGLDVGPIQHPWVARHDPRDVVGMDPGRQQPQAGVHAGLARADDDVAGRRPVDRA